MPQPVPCTNGTTPSTLGYSAQDAGAVDRLGHEARHRGRAVHAGAGCRCSCACRPCRWRGGSLRRWRALGRQQDLLARILRRRHSRARTRQTSSCACAHGSPGAMSSVAKPMIWPNFRIGWPLAIVLRRHLVAAHDARRRRHDALHGDARLDAVDRDDHVVARIEAQRARRLLLRLVLHGISLSASRCAALWVRHHIPRVSVGCNRRSVLHRPVRLQTAQCGPADCALRHGSWLRYGCSRGTNNRGNAT